MNRRNDKNVKRNAWPGAAVLAFVALAASGCSTVRMKPPQDLVRASDEFAATERCISTGGILGCKSFGLGPYRVTDVDRDWIRTDAWGAGGYTSLDSDTGYAFQFQEDGETLAAQCAQFTHQSGYNFGGFELGSSATNLVCICGEGDSAARLEMGGPDQKSAGRVRLARGTLDVSAVHDTNAAWNSSEPAGFRVDEQGKPLGGVEMLHPGRIWLSKELDTGERRQLGCLLAGLMLYDPPSDD